MNLVFALTFAVFLDGEPVGSHRFELSEQDGERRLTSVARFDVKLLGVPVYRYRHEATEQWSGDCLVALSARTHAGGERTEVRSKPERCVMSFAYWNPRILEQRELLNAQTGELERVSVAALGEGRYRISGTKHPIELRYSPKGEWLALDSTVAGGRRLSYRLQ
jgi:hypothetical protein